MPLSLTIYKDPLAVHTKGYEKDDLTCQTLKHDNL